MDILIHADVFFFITSIAVIVVTAVLVVLLVYLVRIVRDVKYISRKAKTETDLLAEDVGDLRKGLRTEGMKFKFFTDFFSKIYKRNKKGRKGKN